MGMIPKEQIKRALRFAQPVLAARFSGPEAQAFLAVMETNYQRLAPEVPVFKSPFNRMTLKIAVDVLAFHQAVLTVTSPPEALELIQPFVNQWMEGQFDRWIARQVYANQVLHRLYRRWWFANANRADEPDGQKFEYLSPTGDLYYGVTVKRCGILKYLTRMGAPELTPFICRGDFHIQKYLPEGIEFKRTQVIAEGGECCDFRY
jgi:hypothetical protein